MYSVMWSEHCSYKSSKQYLRRFGDKVTPKMREHLMVGMGQNAGVVDIGRGWAVTFKVESHNHPSLHRAVPGRRDRRRRHRARHHRDGCPPGRGDGPAALRRPRGGGHAARRARRRGRHRALRQLPRPAEHRRRDRLRPGLPGQPARERARRRGAAPRGPAARERDRRGQQGRPVRRPHGRRRHRRRVDPRLRHVLRRRPDEAARGAGRRPVRREGAHRVLPRAVPRRTSWRRSRTSAPRASAARRASSPRTATAA